jgi:AcrR family transcriptional regulator
MSDQTASAGSIRARVRAEMIEEIKTVARRHLASDGANLSLRAVARDMGMASSAVYRYFASRDDLLTALIIEAYDSVGEAAERAAAAAVSAGASFPDQLVATGHAVREWALAEPHQWALIYGSPVPGYQAPQDTIGPATRVILQIAAIIQDAFAAGRIGPQPEISGRYTEELQAVADRFGAGLPPRLVGAIVAVAFTFGTAVLIAEALDDDDHAQTGATMTVEVTR